MPILLDLSEASLFSGFSLSMMWGVPVLLIIWRLSQKKEKKLLGIGKIIILTSILCFSAFLLNPITTIINRFGGYTSNRSMLIQIQIVLTALCSWVVYLLGLNSEDLRNERTNKAPMLRFLSTAITLVSLGAIAFTFALGFSMSSSFKRGIVAFAYFLTPIAVYSFGYMSKIIKIRATKVIALSISWSIALLLGSVTTLIIQGNIFAYSNNILLFLFIGYFLAIQSKKDHSWLW